ncbi:MAG: alpha-ketoglutarate-dependent dioxygenase AlkB [Bacteroidia bacterium]|nr:alpha-ketoglutarate-dependent dioxygenase AlkB [Bacteroidia bacterium]
MEGMYHKENYLDNPSELLTYLKENIAWDDRMKARKTASYGVAYNYSEISYPFQEFPDELETVRRSIEEILGFCPNNCLLNYYLTGDSTMGYHSDQVDILEEGTGVAILSLGASRVLRFRSITNKEIKHDVVLHHGSLFYMENEIQERWQHAIPKSDSKQARISLTFRKIRDDENWN